MAEPRQAAFSLEPLEGARILVVEARFYEDLADELLKGALGVISSVKAEATVVTVPGALEIPGTIAMAAEAQIYDGFVAIGVVIRGETYHFEIVLLLSFD